MTAGSDIPVSSSHLTACETNNPFIILWTFKDHDRFELGTDARGGVHQRVVWVNSLDFPMPYGFHATVWDYVITLPFFHPHNNQPWYAISY